MSNVTVVSIYPLEITESKPGQTPETYSFDACEDYKNPTIMLVKDAIDKTFVGGDRLSLRVPINAMDVALSLVNDFASSVMLADETARPGFFLIDGKISKEDVLKSRELRDAIERQERWFVRIVEQGDDDFNRTRQHKVITQIQRIAVEKLGLKREWTIKPAELKTIQCPACMEYVSPLAIVCRTCKQILKPEEYKKLAFAG